MQHIALRLLMEWTCSSTCVATPEIRSDVLTTPTILGAKPEQHCPSDQKKGNSTDESSLKYAWDVILMVMMLGYSKVPQTAWAYWVLAVL